MFFPKRLSLRKIAAVKPRKRARQRGRQDSAFIPGPAYCGPTVEKLEERTLLSTVGSLAPPAPAAPTFVINPNVKPQASPGNQGLTPAQIQTAYQVNQIAFNGVPGNGAGQTIAIVDAFNDPDIIKDANSFSNEFGLPAFNSGNSAPTLQVLNEDGTASPLPSNATPGDWDVEESLDVEWVHSIAPAANIILFEASDNENGLYTAEQTAANYPGVSVVSNSWGGDEFQGEQEFDSIFTTPTGHQGVTFLASAGDDGSPAGYPSYSPNVVAVGGTELHLQNSNGTWGSENAWNELEFGEGATGGGISQFESEPSYQDNISTANGASTTLRNDPDVAADADPVSGVWVYDSFANPTSPWGVVGGTSLACPLWAGMIGIADQGRVLAGEGTLDGASQTLPMLYTMPSGDLHDVTTGNNGTYSAGTGYDLVTGLGTPIANNAVLYLAGYNNPPQITTPTTQTLTEDSSLVFSTTNSNSISVSDPWSAGGLVDAFFSTTPVTGPSGSESGTLDLTNTTGLTVVSGTNGTSQFEVSGTVANLNTDLNGLTFEPPAGYVGPDQIALEVVTPGPPLESATADINLSIVATNSPSFSAPLGVSLSQNSSLAFTGGNNISLFDNGGTNEDLTLSVNHGTLDLATTMGLLVTDNQTNSVNAIGNISDIDAALATLTYTATTGYYGPDTLTLHDEDAIDNLTGSASVSITVLALTPTITAPPAVGVIENEPFDFNNSNLIAVNDPSGTSGTNEQMTLQVSHGTLSLTTTGLTSSGSGSASVTLSGPLSTLNSDLSSLVYTPTTGYSGSDTLNVTDEDVPDTLSTTAAVPITVASSPTFNGPTSETLTENASLTFSSAGGNPITVADPFAQGNADSLTLAVSDGTLTLPSTAGLTLTGTNGSSSFTVSGTVNALNSALNGLVYAPNNGYYGTDSLVLSVTDSNNSLTGNVTVTLAVSAIAPELSSPATSVVDENQSLTFASSNNNAIVLSDINAGGDSLALSVRNGNLTLPETSGLTFSTGANGQSSFTVSGSLADLNTALNGLAYQPTTNYHGADTLAAVVTNVADGKSASSSVSITIVALPTVAAPTSAVTTVNTAFTFSSAFGNEINVSDQSAGPNTDSLTLSVVNGRITLGSTTGLTVSNGSNGSASFTISGAIGNIEAGLDGLTYQPNFGYIGGDTLAMTLNDSADNLSGTTDVALTVIAVTAPAITAPATATLSENGSLTFSTANNKAISVADNGEGTNADTETLSVGNGTLTLPSTAGLTFVAGANGGSSFTVKGTVANFNAALNGLIYRPTSNFAGSDSLQIAVVDSGDSKSGSTSVALTVLALPPAITSPLTASVSENSSLAFLPANANTISISDANPGSDSLTVSVSHGTLTLSTLSGLSVTAGANGSASVTVSGTVTNLNQALNGVVYTPTSGYTGTDNLAIQVSDPADGQSTSGHVSLSVVALAAPTISAPSTATAFENGSFVFSTGNSNAISVTDAAAGATTDSLTLSVAHGTLTLASTTGLSFTSGANSSASFTVVGTISALNAALNGLTYRPAANYTGADSLSVSLTDAGDSESGSTIVAVTVIASNAPAISAPSGAVVSENGEIVFSTVTNNAIAVADTGAGSNADSLTLSVSHGTLTLASTTGLTITSGANGAASVTVTGSVANLNAALNGVVYQPSANYTGSDSMAISINDSADNQSASTHMSLSVSGTTSPAIKAPTAVLTKTDNVVFTGAYAISISDPNAGSNVQQLLIKDSGGTLKLGTTTGLTFVSGSNSSMQMVVQGTLANLNAAVATLTYTLTGKTQTIVMVYTNLQDALQGTAAIAVTLGETILSAGTGVGLGAGPATTSTLPPDSEV